MSFKAQFGTAEEETWGTGVTVDRFHEFVEESLQRRQSVISSNGLRPGTRYRRGARRVQTRNDAHGTVRMEVMDQGFGRFFEHMLGAVATTQPDDSNSPTVYAHTFTPGDLLDKSLTLQKGVEKTDGTVQAFTYHGAKIVNWELSIDNDGILMFVPEFDCKEEVTSTGLATASYPSSLAPFHFAQGSLKVDSSAVATVSQATITGSNALKTDRYYLGQSGTKSQQRENEYRGSGGQLTAEFEDLATFYALFTGDTSAELELQFTGALISDDEYTQLTITQKDVRFTGETPQISGPDVPEMTIPWEAFEDASGDSIEIVLQNEEENP